jgi:DNA mismatch endonuclease, patch repair protein
MADTFDKAKRSKIMSLVKSKDTAPERIVFKYLRANKVYFQKHYKRAVGTPDIALPRKKRAVFIDSAFWHGKKYDVILRNRPPDDYWVHKIARNMERDKQQRDALTSDGWKLLVVWEDDIKRMRTRQEVLERIKEFLMYD